MPIDPVTGSLISAGAQYGTQALGTIVSGKSNRKQRKHERELNERNIQAQVDMWNINNAYNDPSQQRKRMEAAGYNPMLLQSGGVTQNTSSMPNLPEQKPLTPDNTGERIGQMASAVGNSMDTYFNYQARQKQLDVMDTEQLLKLQQIAESKDRMHTATFSRASTQANTFKTEWEGLRSQLGLSADETNLKRNTIALAQDTELQSNIVEAANEKLKQMKLTTAKQVIENKQIPEKHNAAMAESLSRLKEAKSRMSEAELRKAIQNEVLKLKQKGIESSDDFYLRYFAKELAPDWKF